MDRQISPSGHCLSGEMPNSHTRDRFIYPVLPQILNPYKPCVLLMGHRQTVKTQMRCCRTRRLIWGFTVCLTNCIKKLNKNEKSSLIPLKSKVDCPNDKAGKVHSAYLGKNEPRCEKTGLRVSDQVQHKPGCTATEDG